MRISPTGLATLAAEGLVRLQPGVARHVAIAQLAAAVDHHTQFVQSVVGEALNQNELDALVMLAIAIGTAAFERSPVVRALAAGSRRQAADAFVLCGAGERSLACRRRERALFLAAVETKDPLAGYTATERRLIREYDRLVRNGEQEERRLALRALLSEQRKRIWRVAQASGWSTANRAERYRSLLARTC